MDARTIKKLLLVLNVLYCTCAGFPRAQLLSARGDTNEYRRFNANSNFSKYLGNNAIVNRSETNKEQLLDNRVDQHESTENKVGEYEGYVQSPLSVIRAMPEDDVKPGKLTVEHPAAYVPRGGSEHAVEQTEQLLSANRNSRRKRDFSQINANSNVTNDYGGDLSNAENLTFSQRNDKSNVSNIYGKIKKNKTISIKQEALHDNENQAVSLSHPPLPSIASLRFAPHPKSPRNHSHTHPTSIPQYGITMMRYNSLTDTEREDSCELSNDK